jgi:hypothetical protein
MVLVVICAIRNLVAADFANVILDLAVLASCKSKTANVTLVVNGIYVSALRKSLAASVALVVVVAICANVMSCALIGTNVLCAICICALITFRTNMLALVRRSFGIYRRIYYATVSKSDSNGIPIHCVAEVVFDLEVSISFGVRCDCICFNTCSCRKFC